MEHAAQRDQPAHRSRCHLARQRWRSVRHGVATEGADYMHKVAWAEHLVAAVQSDGGTMTREDLASYDVVWGDPVRANVRGYDIAAAGAPNSGGTALIEAQQVGVAAGISQLRHWGTSGESLRRAAQSERPRLWHDRRSSDRRA
ncbi:MAG: gamma-glutamyltransferase [Gemmatimonadaceae bacterium]